MPSVEAIASSAGATIGATLGSTLGSCVDSRIAAAAAEASAGASAGAAADGPGAGGGGGAAGFPFGAVIGTSIGAALGSGLGTTLAGRISKKNAKAQAKKSEALESTATSTATATSGGDEAVRRKRPGAGTESSGAAVGPGAATAADPSTPPSAAHPSRSSRPVGDWPPGMVQASPSTPSCDIGAPCSERVMVCSSCGAAIVPNETRMSESGSVAVGGRSKVRKGQRKNRKMKGVGGKATAEKKAHKAGGREGNSKHRRIKSTSTTAQQTGGKAIAKVNNAVKSRRCEKNYTSRRLKRLSGITVLLSSSWYYDLNSYKSPLGLKAICTERSITKRTPVQESEADKKKGKGRKSGGIVKGAGSAIVKGWKRMVERPEETNLLSVSARAYSQYK